MLYELTEQEAQSLVNLLASVKLDMNESKAREQLIGKLQAPVEPKKEAPKEAPKK